MSFTRIVTDNGKTKEETLQPSFQPMNEDERARKKLLEAEIARRTPGMFGALSPHRANIDQPVPKPEAPEESADVRENPEGGKTQGTTDPEAHAETDRAEQEEVAAEEEEKPKGSKKKGRGKDSGTDSSDEGDGDEDTPDEKE